ncbi:MAG: oligosaccharide flippase family protein [Chitinophagales bacterium]
MRKNFITNLVFLLLLNLVVKPLWILGVDRTVQNTVGPEVYGMYFALFNFSFLFQVILDFGINNYINRQVAMQPERLSDMLFSALGAKLLLGLLYTAILFLSAYGIGFNGTQIHLLIGLAILQICMSFYAFFRSNIAALQLFKTDAVLSVLDKAITSILCGAVLLGYTGSMHMDIALFIGIQITGYVFAIAVACIILFGRRIPIHLRMQKELVRKIIRNALPYALLGFLMTAYYRIDGVMLERLLGAQGDYQAGIYASAFRLLDALNIIGFLFAGILMPMFSRMLGQQQDIKPLLELGFRMMLIFCVPAGITCIFFRNDIMTLLYVQGDMYSASILGWLMVSFICISITYIYGSLLTAHGSIHILNYISFAGIAMNTILNFILIPKMLALGSAITTVATQVLILLVHIAITQRIFAIGPEWKKWMRVIAYTGLVIAVGYLGSTLHLPALFAFLAVGILSFALAFPVGLFHFSELRSFIGGMVRKGSTEANSD